MQSVCGDATLYLHDNDNRGRSCITMNMHEYVRSCPYRRRAVSHVMECGFLKHWDESCRFRACVSEHSCHNFGLMALTSTGFASEFLFRSCHFRTFVSQLFVSELRHGQRQNGGWGNAPPGRHWGNPLRKHPQNSFTAKVLFRQALGEPARARRFTGTKLKL